MTCKYHICSSLTSVDIPGSVTSIGMSAFYLCSSLTSVSIGSGIKEIGRLAFDCNYEITEVYVKAETPPTMSISFTFTPDVCNNATLYVPSGTLADYKAADGWMSFAHIVEMDFSDIQAIEADAVGADVPVYDLSGHRVVQPEPGHLYIRNGRKFIAQ